MPQFDMPLARLREYTADLSEPADFDAFWAATLSEAQSHDLALDLRRYPTPWRLIDTYDVTFAGFGGSPVHAWLTVPAGATGPLPTVVQYHGYSGGRGFPHNTVIWALAGYAHFSMDTRGQGYNGGGPEPQTADPDASAGDGHTPGLMTVGILDPQLYYYRRVFTDAVRMLEAAATLDVVDETRLAVAGGSQGGGITLAAAGLAPSVGINLVGAAPDVSFLCDFPRATTLVDTAPYSEITRYLSARRQHVDAAYRTLSYFDGVLLAERATAPALFSVGLMDMTCPPSTVFAAFNRYGTRAGQTDKQIEIYSHNQHEGGGPYQQVKQADFFARVLA